MANTELLFFPRGQVSIDGQNPQQITDFSYSYSNGMKLKPTLRRNPGGKTLGQKQVTFDFNVIIDSKGEEIDWDQKVDSGEDTLIVAKFPGGITKTIIGGISEASAKFTVDDGVARALKGMGMLVLLPGV